MSGDTERPGTVTGAVTVAESRLRRTVVTYGYPVIGAVVGWVIQAGADWLVTHQWLNYHHVANLIVALPDVPRVIVPIVAGGLIGLLRGIFTTLGVLRVTVTSDQVILARGRSAKPVTVIRIDRVDVGAVFADGGYLVITDIADEELAREANELDAVSLRDTFVAYGYPWQDQRDGTP